MKKGTWSILTVAALCMVLFATACATTTTKVVTATIISPATTSIMTTTITSPATTIITTIPITATTTPPTGSSVGVSLVAGAFQPSTLTIKKGTAVTFTNNGNTIFGLIPETGFNGEFGATLPNKSSYTWIFNGVGVFVAGVGDYSFICTITVTN